MKKVIAITIAFGVLFCFNIAIAKGKKEVADNLPLIPFNINVEKLSPNFAGADIVKLFSMLSKKAPFKKEEFETTADYEKKIIAAVTDDVYAFKLPDDNFFYGLNISPYNADTQKLPIKIKTQYMDDWENVATIILKTIDEKHQSYIGADATGVKSKVNKYTGKKYGIAIENKKEFGSGNGGSLEARRTIDTEIEISPNKAKDLKGNIGAIILCKLKLHTQIGRGRGLQDNNLIIQSLLNIEPTIEIPISSHYDTNFVNVEALSIWIYDIRNGEIILKIPITGKLSFGVFATKNDLKYANKSWDERLGKRKRCNYFES